MALTGANAIKNYRNSPASTVLVSISVESALKPAMAEIKPVEQVAPIIGFLFIEKIELETINQGLSGRLGRSIMQSDKIPFTHTDYYNSEMGAGIFRQWHAYEKMIIPDELAKIKTLTNSIEKEYSNEDKNRMVNIDPGYVSLSNLVLASAKNYSHRIYLELGIYAEVTLIFRHGHFMPLEWTYPDYKEPAALEFFEKVREKLKNL